jgi:hypothetical protein
MSKTFILTCHTEGCENAEHPITFPNVDDDINTAFCGPCGQEITDKKTGS